MIQNPCLNMRVRVANAPRKEDRKYVGLTGTIIYIAPEHIKKNGTVVSVLKENLLLRLDGFTEGNRWFQAYELEPAGEETT